MIQCMLSIFAFGEPGVPLRPEANKYKGLPVSVDLLHLLRSRLWMKVELLKKNLSA